MTKMIKSAFNLNLVVLSLCTPYISDERAADNTGGWSDDENRDDAYWAELANTHGIDTSAVEVRRGGRRRGGKQ